MRLRDVGTWARGPNSHLPHPRHTPPHPRHNPTHTSIYLSSIYLSIYPSVQSIYLSTYLSVYLIYLSVYTSHWLRATRLGIPGALHSCRQSRLQEAEEVFWKNHRCRALEAKAKGSRGEGFREDHPSGLHRAQTMTATSVFRITLRLQGRISVVPSAFSREGRGQHTMFLPASQILFPGRSLYFQRFMFTLAELDEQLFGSIYPAPTTLSSHNWPLPVLSFLSHQSLVLWTSMCVHMCLCAHTYMYESMSHGEKGSRTHHFCLKWSIIHVLK